MRNSRHLRCAGQHTSEGSSSCVFLQKSCVVWRGLSKRERRIMQALSRGSPDAVLRCRCKVILALVQGKSPTTIAEGGLCSASQVYRVAHRFIEQGPQGLPDRREDNGENKVTESLRVGTADSLGRVSPRPRLLEADLDSGTSGPSARGTDWSYGERDDHESAAETASRAAWSPQTDRGLPVAQVPPNAATGVDSTVDPELGPG